MYLSWGIVYFPSRKLVSLEMLCAIHVLCKIKKQIAPKTSLFEWKSIQFEIFCTEYHGVYNSSWHYFCFWWHSIGLSCLSHFRTGENQKTTLFIIAILPMCIRNLKQLGEYTSWLRERGLSLNIPLVGVNLKIKFTRC